MPAFLSGELAHIHISHLPSVAVQVRKTMLIHKAVILWFGIDPAA